MNDFVLRNYLSASSLKNYVNNDPVLDYFKWLGFRKENMTDFLKLMSRKGMVHEEEIFRKIKDYCRYNNISYVDLSEVQFKDKFEPTLRAIQEGVDIILDGLVIGVNYPLYGCPDIIMKERYINLLDRIDHTLPVLCTEDCPKCDRYCIIEIKSCSVYIVDTWNELSKTYNPSTVINKNFRSHESQAHIYSLCLRDMLYIMDKQYSPKTYIHVKKIWRSSGNLYIVPNLYRMIEVDSSIHRTVMQGIYWIKSLNKYSLGLNLFPNPENKYDYPYKTLKLITALIIGDIAYLPGCNLNCRGLMLNKGIRSIYDPRFTPDSIPVSKLDKVNIVSIMKANITGVNPSFQCIKYKEGIYMYTIGRKYSIFLINGRIFKRIPVWCRNHIVYYYSCDYPAPRLPERYTLVNIKEKLEINGIILRGMINFSLQSVSIAMYINGITDQIYTHSKEDIHLIQKIHKFITY